MECYLCSRKERSINIFISFVVFGLSLIVLLQFGRRDIIASPPDLHLFFAMLFDSLQFVETLKSSIVTFVQPPILDNRDIVAVNLISCIIIGLDGSGQH